MSSFRLPRLTRDKAIVDSTGKPETLYQRWWQSVVEQIEGAIQNIRQLLIDVGIAQETADGSLELAQKAINEDGTIKTDKVLTQSMTTDAVTERYFAQALSNIALPDGIETEVVSVTVLKVLDDSEMDIDVSIRLASNDDVRGAIRVYRNGLEIDSFGPYLNGDGGTYRVVLTLPYTESDIPAGSYLYRVTFTREGGASSLEAGQGSLLRIKEIKR